ncbi:nucleotidyltransferase [Herbiconiux sp. VKM Ac-2851]|uniref:nucleotidyltransferase n=1 Tax=Herbiconiux sp. VKM Ac-2851 TaxID=2739025 RepID=UPI001565FA1B|nr:nucleotidyltransferase [Herbiconiux sp. VKM Ac-2851]NQX37082.1 nucleotidyltransferase [Herbiconiux sp. VKM Ac-2851]
MPERTIATAFETLLSRKVPTEGERSAAARHRASIEKSLSQLENFGLRETGSFRHGTAVRGHSDVDVLVSLGGGRPASSDTALERVRSALAWSFPFTPIRVSRPAVVVDFAGGDERWEVIPGYYERSNGNHSVYSIPAPGGGWIETAPSAHLAYVTDENRSPQGGAKGLARLVKTWKYANTSGAKVSSFYLEMRAAQRMSKESSFIPYLDFAYLIRDLANSNLADMNDPTGVTGRFRAASTENYRSTAVTMLAADAKRVADAIELEKAGRRSEAFKKLAYVFVGTTFPAQFY